jgi:hypothetical protein
MLEREETFRRNTIRPIECLSEGWRLIGGHYWLFVGITALGYVIGYATPMYLLLGPMMCGIYLCLIARQRGQAPSMDLLFKGFDYFVDGLIATMLFIVPMIVLFMVAYFGFIFTMIVSMPGGGRGRPGFVLSVLAFMMLSAFAISIVVQVLFSFAYPLIVERRMKGAPAVLLSFKAASANFGGLFLLHLIDMAMCLVGSMFCGVGVVLVLPISFATAFVAYRRVFPELDDWDDFDSDSEPLGRAGDEAWQTNIELPTRRRDR